MLVAPTLERSALSFCDVISFQYRSSRTAPRAPPFTYLPLAFITRRRIVIKREKRNKGEGRRKKHAVLFHSHIRTSSFLRCPFRFLRSSVAHWTDTHLNLSHVVSWERERNYVVEKSLRRAYSGRCLLKGGELMIDVVEIIPRCSLKASVKSVTYPTAKSN